MAIDAQIIYQIKPATGTSVLWTVQANAVVLDSSTAPLGIGLSYTTPGTGVDVTNYPFLNGTVFADQNGTLYVEFSNDAGVNWDGQESTAYAANQLLGIKVARAGLRARVVFTNGAVAQTQFRLYLVGSTLG